MTPEQEQQINEINSHLERALQGFIGQPNEAETRSAIYSAFSTALEVAIRRLVEEHIQVESEGDSVLVTLGIPLSDAVRGVLGDDVFEHLFENCAVKLPGWSKPDFEGQAPAIGANRIYIDPRTGRPTRGRPNV